jgi:hypothetical protein
LKFNVPVALDRQEIWRYSDPPVMYGSGQDYRMYYPFRDYYYRAVEHEGYEARYRLAPESGDTRTVLYASDVDKKETAELRLDSENGKMFYTDYDVTSDPTKALLRLGRDGSAELYVASIWGRPIVLELNRTCYVFDKGEVAANGTVVLNVTGQYFSSDEFDGKEHYVHWVERELVERIIRRREVVVRTHKALFNARVGAVVKVDGSGQVETRELTDKIVGKIEQLAFHVRRDKAFWMSARIIGGVDYEN